MRRILILKPCCLGDVLMATPMLAALSEAFPEATIDWAVGTHSRPAIQGHPGIRNLLDASHCIRGELRPTPLLRLLRAIRRGRYDLLVVPDRSPILSLVSSLSGVPTRAGLASGWRGFGYTHPIPIDPDAHEARLYLSLAETLAPDPASLRSLRAPRITFHPSPDDHLAAGARILDALGVDRGRRGGEGPRVAIHPSGGVNPGMTLLSKRWPPDRFASIAERLVRERGATILLLGGPDDRGVAAAVINSIGETSRKRVINLAGRLGLGETAAAIQSCDLYIGNDTGVSHIACGVGTPCLMIFGPTSPTRYGPLPGSGMALAPSELSPGHELDAPLRTASSSTAIEAVTVDQVWDAVQQLLDAQAG